LTEFTVLAIILASVCLALYLFPTYDENDPRLEEVREYYEERKAQIKLENALKNEVLLEDMKEEDDDDALPEDMDIQLPRSEPPPTLLEEAIDVMIVGDIHVGSRHELTKEMLEVLKEEEMWTDGERGWIHAPELVPRHDEKE
jgi:hypothetical protein